MLSTDDHMAEMLDVSAENLIRMQEEAAMTDPETLMRYIRVFSELSGQLRYATQKRVLVEIALIKLCRPSMEKNYDSLLQRISQIEQKLEQGAVYAPAAAGTDSLAQKMPAAQREKLPREAMSEDVQLFINRFQELRRKMGGMQSQQLKDAVVRELPEGAGIQVILGRELPVDEQALSEDLQRMIEKELHVQMKVQVHTPHTDPRPQEPVADLSGFIDMEIEVDSE